MTVIIVALLGDVLAAVTTLTARARKSARE
jgi:hypothetical protein